MSELKELLIKMSSEISSLREIKKDYDELWSKLHDADAKLHIIDSDGYYYDVSQNEVHLKFHKLHEIQSLILQIDRGIVMKDAFFKYINQLLDAGDVPSINLFSKKMRDESETK